MFSADNYRDIRLQQGGGGFDNQPAKNGSHPPFKGMEVVRGRGRPRGRSRGGRGGRGGGRGGGVEHRPVQDTGIVGGNPVPPVGSNPRLSGGVVEVTLPGGGGEEGGCPPEGALAQPIGHWQPTDESDVTRPRVESDEEENISEKMGALRVQTSPEGAASGPMSPLSPGAGWTTPTDHTHVVDWAAEANNNSSWGLPPTSPSSEVYNFNPSYEAAASASVTWGHTESEQEQDPKDPSSGPSDETKTS